ncbi:TMEM175 family protein [Tomitella fengzijianii]|uniref:TMEM175 family protein n=1 Tax=Tomitella fengzijianii TaxID=2597660 RepID=UPI00131EBB18|nr:TMEM175 family protein [Tomitella fengzijianii]
MGDVSGEPRNPERAAGWGRGVGAAGVFGTGRLEAFSDGVIAVAITLLVLDLRVPGADGARSLAHALGALWPNYLAYVISFLAIGIIWINHHTLMRRLAGADRSVLALNLVLLMCIAVLPFTTSLMATYLDVPGGRLAAVVYAAAFLVTSAVFLALEAHVLRRRPHLLRAPLPAGERRAVLRRGALAPPAYLIAGLLGLATPYLTLAVCVLMGLFYLAGPRRGG